jgi:large repetitive protein
VNSPATSTTHTVSVQLTNPAPLVFHVFAVSGSDVTGPPIFSAITDPGAGGTSANVATAPITVPTNSLLLSWVKNETSATATVLNGYTLDTQSSSFLWAEFQSPISAGFYTGNFQYDSAIGWQTAILGVKPHSTGPPTPVITSTPANPTNQTSASFSFTDTAAGVSFLCQLDGSAFSACSSPAAYSSLGQGSHTFLVKAQDTGGNQSAAAIFTWNVDTSVPPTPVIASTPANPTNQTSASFSFADTETGVSFQCQLDGSAFGACSSPKTYSGLSQGTHTFSVQAQDAAGNQSAAASFTWVIDTTAPPTPVITSIPLNPTNQTTASFSFTDTQTGVSFQCQLDGSAFSSCSSPKTYSGLSQGTHTFSVQAQDAPGNRSAAATFTWNVDTTAPAKPVITSTPANPTNQTSASFSFADKEAGVTFLCQLDSSAYTVCSSPIFYPGPLSQGKHSFSVRAQDAAGNLSGTASFRWKIIP